MNPMYVCTSYGYFPHRCRGGDHPVKLRYISSRLLHTVIASVLGFMRWWLSVICCTTSHTEDRKWLVNAVCLVNLPLTPSHQLSSTWRICRGVSDTLKLHSVLFYSHTPFRSFRRFFLFGPITLHSFRGSYASMAPLQYSTTKSCYGDLRKLGYL